RQGAARRHRAPGGERPRQADRLRAAGAGAAAGHDRARVRAARPHSVRQLPGRTRPHRPRGRRPRDTAPQHRRVRQPPPRQPVRRRAQARRAGSCPRPGTGRADARRAHRVAGYRPPAAGPRPGRRATADERPDRAVHPARPDHGRPVRQSPGAAARGPDRSERQRAGSADRGADRPGLRRARRGPHRRRGHHRHPGTQKPITHMPHLADSHPVASPLTRRGEDVLTSRDWRALASRTGYVASCALAAIVLAVAGYANYVEKQVSGLASSNVDTGGPQTGAMNILLMGLESRTDYNGNVLPAGLLAAMHAGSVHGVLHEGVGGQATNTLILIHIFAGGQKAVGFSIPRDDLVTFPQPYDGESEGKIDQAYGLAWAQSLNQTVSSSMSRDRRYFLANEAGQAAAIATVSL